MKYGVFSKNKMMQKASLFQSPTILINMDENDFTLHMLFTTFMDLSWQKCKSNDAMVFLLDE